MRRTSSIAAVRRSSSIALVALLLASSTHADSGDLEPSGKLYGAELTLQQPVSLGVVMQNPERFAQAPVLIRGELVDVCQRKGCWTILRDGEAFVRIRFHGYSFFIPKDSRGREAVVQGHARVTELSESDARHYEAERIGGDPTKIVGPRREVGFEATGLRILSAN